MRQESGSEELPSKEARARASKRETEGLELPKKSRNGFIQAELFKEELKELKAELW